MAAAASLASHEVPSFVLLDTRSSIITDHQSTSNSTTATSRTSTHLPIEVTFFAADPPALSYLFVHCPGLEVDPTDLSMAPKIVSTDADLVLLRVLRNPMARTFSKLNPYEQPPKLSLIPNPTPELFNDNEIAILSYGDDSRFVVATLKIRPICEFSFVLHTYRSGPDPHNGGKPAEGLTWTSQVVTVEEPQRDIVCPIPDTAEMLLYHLTTKVITLGGAKGTVGFVDLWRGILLCDLLGDSSKLRDMPLPLPAKGNWRKFLSSCPHYCRDIAVNQSKDTIKYVEMEITQPALVAASSDSDSYYEWLSQQNRLTLSYSLVPGSWKMTTWSMPISATSWNSWHRRCTIRSEDVNLPSDNTRHYELLCKLMMSTGVGNEEEKVTNEATLSLGCLRMAYPTMSIADDDDVVYLLSKGISTRSVKMGVAVDASTGTLQGVVKLDPKRHVGFMRCCIASGISKYLITTAPPNG